MCGVEVGRPYMSGVDDGTVSACDGDRVEELHWAMEVAEIVSAGVCTLGN